jgi:simple sugar transport system ATP-binding protein
VELVSKLLGKALQEMETVRKEKEETAPVRSGAPALRARNLGKDAVLAPFDLDIHPGEVVGLAGLLGSGRTEMASLLFGIEKADGGELSVGGRPVRFAGPLDALQAGIGLIPEDRKGEGIIEDLSVRENIVLALQVKRGWWQTLSRAQQDELAERYIRLLGIKTPSADQAIKNLSGGNQQKAVVARWLAAQPNLLILDEPTRGIDVGAKAEIQKLVLALAEQGMGVLFISSELDEVLRCADRIVVLRDRAKVGELSADRMDEQTVMRTIAQTGPAGGALK